MKIKSIQALLVTLALAAAAYSQEQPPSNTSLENELRTVTREMHDLLLRGDKERLFEYFADDFVGTSHNGFTLTKEQLVKSFRTPPPEAKITREIKDFKARGTSESAVVNYRVIENVELGDDKHSNEFLYTDTFIKRDGRWQVLASQATRVQPEPKPAKVDPAIYDSYAGHYAASPTLVFTVTRQGNSLIGEAPNGEKVELIPENDTTFFVKGRSDRTVFVKDAGGRVTHLLIGSTKLRKID